MVGEYGVGFTSVGGVELGAGLPDGDELDARAADGRGPLRQLGQGRPLGGKRQLDGLVLGELARERVRVVQLDPVDLGRRRRGHGDAVVDPGDLVVLEEGGDQHAGGGQRDDRQPDEHDGKLVAKAHLAL